MLTIALAPPASRAQALETARPPISLNKAKYFAEHPGAYKDFLAHLPKPGVNTSEGVAARAVPGTGGSWTALAAAPSGGNGLYAPHLLTDGSVLFEAGTNAQWYKLTPDNTGSYVNGTYSTIALLPVINGQQYAPLYHASAVLPDGRLVIVGGEYNANQVNNQSDQGGNVYTNLGAIYDPIANKWTNVPQPSNFPSNYNGYLGTIGDAESTVLNDGTFLLGGCCAPTDAADLFNASTLAWTSTPAPSNQGTNGQDEMGYEILPNGNVLTIDVNGSTAFTSTEQYVPSSHTWISGNDTPVPLGDLPACGAGEIGPAVLRPDGTLVAFGGYSLSNCTAQTNPETTDPTAILNTSTGDWIAGPDVPSVCGASSNAGCTLADAPAAMLPNGNVLFAAAPGYTDAGTHFFEYTAANTVTQVQDPLQNASSTSAYNYNFLVLPTGQILMTDSSDTPEVYTPVGTPNANYAPVISQVASTIAPGSSANAISGTQFNGLSQGADYGDDVQTATNYPIVRITNTQSGHVFYARTYNHSTMSVAPGQAGSTTFSVPASIETGPSTLVVIANGISSAPVAVNVSSVVTPISTKTTLVAAPNPSVAGQSVNFTASVTPATPGAPTGSVTFLDGTKTLGTGPLNSGQATFATTTLAAGNHSITAVYGGDSNFLGSTSTALTQSVSGIGKPTYTVSPMSVPFGGVGVTVPSASQAVTIKNTGTVTLTITGITVSGNNPGEFKQTNNCTTPVAASGSCLVTIVFTPATGGARSANLNVKVGSGGATQSVPLTGTGVVASFTLSPPTVAFGSQLHGTTSAAQTVTLSNTSSVTLPLTSVHISGTNPTTFALTNGCGTSVASGAQCSLSVTFKPTAKGAKSATLNVAGGAGAGAKSVALSGTGT